MITGCQSKPTVTDANNYLLIQTELVKLKAYRESVVSMHDDLTKTPTLYRTDWITVPDSSSAELSTYLVEHDCTKIIEREKFMRCYKETRLRLITITEKYDNTELNSYILNKTVGRMISNIDAIINGFPAVDTLSK